MLLLSACWWEGANYDTISCILEVAGVGRADHSASLLLHHYCDHVLVRLLQLDEHGHQLFAYCVNPDWDHLLVPHGVLQHVIKDLLNLRLNIVGWELVVVLKTLLVCHYSISIVLI